MRNHHARVKQATYKTREILGVNQTIYKCVTYLCITTENGSVFPIGPGSDLQEMLNGKTKTSADQIGGQPDEKDPQEECVDLESTPSHPL